MEKFIITCKKCGSTDCTIRTGINFDDEDWFTTIEDTYQAYIKCCSCDTNESEF